MQVVTVMGVQISPRRIPMSREQFLQLPEGPPFVRRWTPRRRFARICFLTCRCRWRHSHRRSGIYRLPRRRRYTYASTSATAW
jgi:hypothetical protein